MMHARLFSLNIALALGLATAASAQGLSPADCEEIRLQYGVTPPACTGNTVAGTPTAGLTDRMRESHIFFLGGGARLDAQAQAQLAKLVAVLETAPLKNACLKLVGHSDSVGAEAANVVLSQRRADVISEFLTRALTNPARVELAIGIGESQPLPGFAPTAAENRRVEVFARDCATPQATLALQGLK